MNLLDYFRIFNYVATMRSYRRVFKVYYYFFLREKGLDNIIQNIQ